MTNFDDFKLSVEALSGGTNTVILDDLGMPSIMVRVPKLKISDIITGGSDNVHPAFIVDGVENDTILVSKYQNVVVNDRAYSLPFKNPAVNVNFDRSLTVCRNKGAGWHLMTNALWAAIALWCKKNGTMPHGNNNYGQDVDFPHERGVPTSYGSDGRPNSTATGSGPVTWYHNYDSTGIADLNGNVWEWSAGMRIVDSEIQIIPDGNAMKFDCNMSATSTEWKAILADGTLVEPGTEGTVKYGTAYWDAKFSSITTTPAATGAGIALLESLGLIPHAGSVSADYGNDTVWTLLTGEQVPRRGGPWFRAASAGVFAFTLDYVRSVVSANLGFRSAYYE